VGYLEQEPLVDETKTVREVVEEGVQEAVDLLDEFEEINERLPNPCPMTTMDKLIQRQGEVQEKLDALDAWDLDARLEMAMDALRCPPGDTPVRHLRWGTAPGGPVPPAAEKAGHPAAGRAHQPPGCRIVAWLEHHLKQYAGTIIAVTHDRYFLDNVAGWILELDRGHGIPWKGNYSSWLEQKQKRLANGKKAKATARKPLSANWSGSACRPRAAAAKSKARISAYEKLLEQEPKRTASSLEIFIPPGPRLGDRGHRGRGRDQSLRRNCWWKTWNFQLPPGGIVGWSAPMGPAKPPCFSMITGQENPDSGAFRIGETVSLAYVDQSRMYWIRKKISGKMISGGRTPSNWGGARSTPGPMWPASIFPDPTSRKKSVLSGGQRNRVHLAKMLKSGPTCCCWTSPPTIWTSIPCGPWKRPWKTFGGCAVVISHDRWFLDRIATHILAFEGDSRVLTY
jgi:sulfate-transporting ATPase